MTWCDVVEPRTLRDCRIALGQSQAAFAAMLGVPPRVVSDVGYRTAGNAAEDARTSARVGDASR